MIDYTSIWPQSNDELGNVQTNPILVAYLRGGYVPTPGEAANIAALELEELWAILRSRRNNLLSQSDWTQLPDAPHNPAWAVYRQALRDLPQNTVDPSSVVWPESP